MQISSKLCNRKITFLLVIMLTMSMLTACGKKKSVEDNTADGNSISNEEETKKETVTLPLDTVMLSIDSKEYTLSDLMYYVYTAEQDGEIQEIEYSNLYDFDFWTSKLFEGSEVTGTDLVRESAMKKAKYYTILASVAEKAGYKCDKEEEAENKLTAKEILDTMDETYLKRTGFTQKNLEESLKKYAIVGEYIFDQAEKQKVDKKKAEANINKSDYKQRKLEYVFIESTYVDDQGEYQYYGPEDVTALLKKGNLILEKVQAGTDMEAARNEVVGKKELNFTYNVEAMFEDELAKNEDMLNAIKGMKEGQLYDDLMETENGYYIFRLVSNDATEAYENAVAEQMNLLKIDAFYDAFEKTLEEYKIVENIDAWNQIEMKHYAYPESIDVPSSEGEEATEEDMFDLSDLTDRADTDLSDEAANGDDGSVG